MSGPAIQTEGLGKRYFIGGEKAPYRTAREAVVRAARAPFHKALRLMQGQAGAAAGLSRTIWALRNLDLEVRSGEALGIVGRNGAGKTTLLKILSRITSPTEGRARIHGRVGSLLEVGTGFHPELTGRENVFLNGSILGMRRSELAAKFDRIVTFAEVEKFIDTPVKFYSSGMYVRLAFAVAAHLQPEILLVDEVLSVGDVAFQRKCLGRMGEVTRGGRTVLFVSHNMVAVQSLCDRVICLHDGSLVGDGPPGEVIPAYLRTVGSTPRNERLWADPKSAPGADAIRLRRVSVRPDGGDSSDPIETDQGFVLEFEYWSLRPAARMGINFHLTAENGVLVFGGGTFGSREWDEQGRPAGLYRSSCRVPGILNAGAHFLTVQLVKGNRFVHVEQQALSFEIRDLQKREIAWHGKTAGVVRPALEWTSERVEEDQPVLVER